jgi:hypothetical protein
MGEGFFRELFQKPAEMEYSYHPSERVLRAYLSGALGDEWHFDQEFLPKLRRADLDGDWGLSEVSIHLLTCDHCSARVAQLRAEEVATLEEGRAREYFFSWLRALARLASWLILGQRMERGCELPTRPWPAEQLLSVGLASLEFPLLAFSAPLGVSALSPVNLNLFHQRLRSGL